MALKATTTINWDPLQKAKEMTTRVAGILRTVGAMWKFGMMPNHFEAFSGAKYGYRPRTTEYIKRKMAKWGHRRELIWSGRLFRAAAVAPVQIFGAKGKAYVKLSFRGGFKLRRMEIFKTIASERERLRKLIKSAVYQFLWARTPPKNIENMGD